MEREGNAAAAAGAGLWEASPDGVIVLSAGSAAVWQNRHHHHQREQQVSGHGSAAGIIGEFPEPPEKVYYKTKLCEKFEAGGRCAYEDGCTFAHGHAELRPPLPVPPALVKRRMAAAEHENGRGPAGFPGGGKVCFEFRDKGTCHWGAKCAYAHASAAEAAGIRYPGGPRLVEPARRSATPPARAFSPGPAAAGATRGGSGSYAPGTARAFSPVPAAAGQDDAKVTRLELLSRRKLSGVYGDWPEED
ncbi:zinc finger CCCH domain-containing protein 1-like [Phragmites australis]|uniref:zinc finger CCCH domain-containing protein 1-like n=1 Tax=Phragmites australis TaxID=29695 RepID=UPI002D7981E5|nr:zinc finger CCCH domain-containing protein 1-like [Phragmites australis]